MTQRWPRNGQRAVKKNLNLLLNTFERYCVSAFKVRRCNHAAVRNSCAYNFFPFVKPGSKNVKKGLPVMIPMQAFLLGDCSRTQTYNRIVRKQTLNHYAKLGFPICLQTNAEFKCSLNYQFYFFYLYCLTKLHGLVK